jgi:tRNA/tmRNA/rRNA uracil-C5-methylase (TrmA/RlmC/RlmD family)
MCPVAKQVIGVEIVEEAVLAAKESVKENNIDNCDYICGDVLKVLDDIEEKPDLIIVDPPRDGIHPKALTKILDYGVKNIIYISCKATSLMRDLEPIQEAGYRVKRACAVEQFPWTANIETVCLLAKEPLTPSSGIK